MDRIKEVNFSATIQGANLIVGNSIKMRIGENSYKAIIEAIDNDLVCFKLENVLKKDYDLMLPKEKYLSVGMPTL